MATIEFEGTRLPIEEGETVLDVLLRAGHMISHRCRSGICRSCAMVAVEGEVGEAAQAGLAELERRRGVFLTCQLRPRADMVVRSLDDRDAIEAEIVELERRGSVAFVRLRPSQPLDYEAGQFVIVQRADTLARSYSLASLPSEPLLELHVRRVPEGRMSGWLHDEARVGTKLTLRGPYGSCCHPRDELDAPLLLVGVGIGMAPLWGVLRQALARGHRGPITVIEAALVPRDLYLHEPLRELAATHNLRVRSSVLREGEGEYEQSEVDALALACLKDAGHPPKSFLAFVCGDAAIVQRIRKGLFLAGVSGRRIFVDPFE